MQTELQRRRVIAGIRIFVFLSIVGLLVVFYFTSSERTWHIIRDFKKEYLLIATVLILVDFFSGAARVYIFTRRIVSRSFGACFKANLANICNTLSNRRWCCTTIRTATLWRTLCGRSNCQCIEFRCYSFFSISHGYRDCANPSRLTTRRAIPLVHSEYESLLFLFHTRCFYSLHDPSKVPG